MNKSDTIFLDVIILSNTVSQKTYEITMQCIESLIRSESDSKDLKMSILLVESNKKIHETNYVFPSEVKLLIPSMPFGFHRFLNLGIDAGSGQFVALCNNDIIFHPYWFTYILDVYRKNDTIYSFSPRDPTNGLMKEFGTMPETYFIGYDVRRHIAGWCIVAQRKLFDLIRLDERFDFYYADDDYGMTLRKNCIKHALVRKAEVVHLGSVVTSEVMKEESTGAGFSEMEQDLHKKLPSYLRKKEFGWILTNRKLLIDHLRFHEKWGGIKEISIKNKIYALLSKFKLKILVRLLYRV